MEQDGKDIARADVPLAGGHIPRPFTELGSAVVDAQEHRKAHVAGYRKKRPGQRHGESVSHYVFDILKRGEPQRYEDGIYYSVKGEVEIGVPPGAEPQEKELGPLLHDGDHDEGQQDHIGLAAGIHENIQELRPDRLQNDGYKRSGDAKEQQYDQQRERFLFNGILFIDISQQQGRGRNSGGDIDDVNHQ